MEAQTIFYSMSPRGVTMSWDGEKLAVEWAEGMSAQEVCFWALDEAVRKKHE
jgi:hypothetical protein